MTTTELATKLRTYNEGTYELMLSFGADPETIAAAIRKGLIIQRTAGGATALYSVNLYRAPPP